MVESCVKLDCAPSKHSKTFDSQVPVSSMEAFNPFHLPPFLRNPDLSADFYKLARCKLKFVFMIEFPAVLFLSGMLFLYSNLTIKFHTHIVISYVHLRIIQIQLSSLSAHKYDLMPFAVTDIPSTRLYRCIPSAWHWAGADCMFTDRTKP